MSSYKEQIFIMDNDKSMCHAQALMILNSGHLIRQRSSLVLCTNSASGCLILDLPLPGLNGWETQQRLFKTGSKRPVIVRTVDKEM